MFRVMKWFLPEAAAGAQTSIYLASSPEVEQISGRYFEKCADKEPSKLAHDEALAESLWEATQALVAR